MLIEQVSSIAEEKCLIGDPEMYEPFTENIGLLFKDLQKDFGRCVSKMYVDDSEGNSHHVGWVFQKRCKYEDTKEMFTLETWISLHEDWPSRTYNHKYLS